MDFVEVVALVAAMHKGQKGYVPPINDNEWDEALDALRARNIPGVKV